MSTNKNRFTLAWAAEMVEQNVFDFIRISFMIAGHTKFSPDLLFTRISQTYHHSDVFNTEDLKEVALRYAGGGWLMMVT